MAATSSLTKHAPAAVRDVIIDADGVYAAIDADGDWIFNRAGVARTAHVTLNYTRDGVLLASARPASDRGETLAQFFRGGGVALLRCAELSAYIIVGGPAAEYQRRVAVGRRTEPLIDELDRLVGAAEALPDGWPHLAFLQAGGRPVAGLHIQL